MTYRSTQGWGMPFIVSPNYVPKDPEWTKHYKPDQQGCAECNGAKIKTCQKTSRTVTSNNKR